MPSSGKHSTEQNNFGQEEPYIFHKSFIFKVIAYLQHLWYIVITLIIKFFYYISF